MAIEFNCPYCTAPIRVPDSAGGKRGTCPRCKTGILVPTVPTKPKLKGAAKKSESEPSAEPAPAKKSKKQSARERFADEPDFTNFAGVESSEPAATATHPAPAAISRPAPPPPPPPGAAPVVTPISQSLKRRKRRRYAWVPILFGAILVGGVSIFFMIKKATKLEGELQAKVVGNAALKQRLIRAEDVDVEQAKVKRVLKQLEETQFQFSRFSFAASPAGISVQPHATTATDVFEVDISNRKELMEFFKENADELDAFRRREYDTGLKAFFTEAAVILEDSDRIPDDLVREFQSKVLENAFIDVKGYHLVASLNGKGYHCIYQQGNILYFLLPKGTKHFRLFGRKLSDGNRRVKANYYVQVVESQPENTVKTTTVDGGETTPAAPNDE